MPNSSDIRAGRAFVELGANDSALQKALNRGAAGLKALGSQVRQLGAGLAAVGASIVAPLAAAAGQFGRMGAEVAKAAAITGISAEAISTLGYAAQQAGVELSAVESGIGRLNKLMLAAATGNQQANTTLAQLGLNFQKLNGLSPENRFKAIADAISKVADPGQRAAMAMQIFGKQGAELLPLLNQGAAGINAFQDEARSLGLQMSGEDAAAALKYSQTLKTLWDVLQHGVFQVGAAVAPALTAIARATTSAAQAATAWVKEHKELIATAFLVAGAVLTLGAAIVGLGTIVTGLGMAMSLTATAIAAFGSVVGFVLSPLGLIGAALGAAGYAFVNFTAAGRSAAESVGSALSAMGQNVASVFGGVKDALAGGDFKLAGQIIVAEMTMMWARLKVLWNEGVEAITSHFAGTVNVMRNAWALLVAEMTTAWKIATEAIVSAWGSVTNYIASAWSATTTWFSKNSGGMWDAFKRGLMAAFDYAVFAFSAMEAMGQNWRTTMALVWNSVELGAVKAFEQIKYYIMEVIPTSIGWLVGNAPKLFVGMFMKLWEMLSDFFKRAWDFVADIGPKIASMLWDAIKGGANAAQAFGQAEADSFMRGFGQDVQKTGGPQFQQRQKSDTEKSLESEQQKLAGDLGQKIQDAYARNSEAMSNLQQQLTKPPAKETDGKSPLAAAETDLAKAQKELAELLKQARLKSDQAAGAKGPQGLQPQIQSDGFKNLQQKGTTAGTFSAAAARELGGGAGATIARQTKRTADLLTDIKNLQQRLNQNLLNGVGATFG